MARSFGRTKRRRILLKRRLLIERLADRRVLAAITGDVFEDLNHSMIWDQAEVGAAERLVFVDLNLNHKLDPSEPISLTSSDGQFQISGLEDGEYSLRLLDTNAGQLQTVPVQSEVTNHSWAISGSSSLLVSGEKWFALGTGELTVGQLDQSGSVSINIDGALNDFELLPDGKLLVVGAQAGLAASWIVDPETKSTEAIEIPVEYQSENWVELVIDSEGRGLILPASTESTNLLAIEYSSLDGLQLSSTGYVANDQTSLLSSATGQRTLLAWQDGNDLVTSLWSRSLNEPIEGGAGRLASRSEAIAFDDDSGLVIVRDLTGRVHVHDVDQNYADLQQFDDLVGPIAFSAGTNRIASLSDNLNQLKLHDSVNGVLLEVFPVDLSAVGNPLQLTWRDEMSVVVLGDQGLAEIGLHQPAERSVVIAGGIVSDRPRFGLREISANSAPQGPELITFSMDEDKVLTGSAGALLVDALDADGDQIIVLQQTEALHGVITVGFDGSFQYQPNNDFFGNEWIKLRFYDGRNFSEEVDLQIEVKAVADAPSSIESSVADISQTILAGSVLGTFSVTDPDSKGRYEFVFSDPRFGIADGRLNGSEQQIVFVDGSVDFALEPEIEVTLSVLDAEADASVDSVLKFKVQDPNGPSLSIFPDSIRIDENTEDMLLTTLTVHDPYYSGAHLFSVDDERFSIVGDQLYLQPGVTVDHETEPVIALVVMASRENDTSVSVKETLLIDVTDVPEQPLVIDLSSYTVLEKVQGSAVGIVTIDGGFTKSRFQVSVDDSRFEVSDGILKLLDNQIVERASQNEIELTLWVDDLEGVFHAISEKFVISVAENSNPHHNVDDPFDVDRSGVVTALDALAIINYLNVYGPGPIHRTDDDYAYDVNADQLVTSLDVLLVLNELNRQQSNGDAVGSGEQVEVNSDGLPAKDPESNSENGSPQELPVPSPTVTSDVSISGIGQSDLEQQADLSIGQVVDEQLSIEIEGDGVNSTLDDTLDLLSGDASIEGGS